MKHFGNSLIKERRIGIGFFGFLEAASKAVTLETATTVADAATTTTLKATAIPSVITGATSTSAAVIAVIKVETATFVATAVRI